jgi:hypothetical protein
MLPHFSPKEVKRNMLKLFDPLLPIRTRIRINLGTRIWIRISEKPIWILISVKIQEPWRLKISHGGSVPDPDFLLSRIQQEQNRGGLFLLFCLFLTIVTFTSVFKDHKLFRSHSTVKKEINVFLISVLFVYGTIRILIADPDPYKSKRIWIHIRGSKKLWIIPV